MPTVRHVLEGGRVRPLVEFFALVFIGLHVLYTYLIRWVAAQYHWILDESVLYLCGFVG